MLGLGLGLEKEIGKRRKFDPSYLPDLLHWYRFNKGISSATVQSADDQITSWTDAKGSNNVAPSATDNKGVMPRHGDGDADPAVPNVVFFQGNSDTLEFTSDLSLGKFAIYFRINWKDETLGSQDLMEADAGNADFLKLAGPTEARIKIGGRHDFTIDEIVEGTPFVLGFERDGDGDMMIYKDNIAGSAADGDSLNVAISTTLDLGRMGAPGNNAYWYEVVICNDSLTAKERKDLYYYLRDIDSDGDGYYSH